MLNFRRWTQERELKIVYFMQREAWKVWLKLTPKGEMSEGRSGTIMKANNNCFWRKLQLMETDYLKWEKFSLLCELLS